MIYHMGKKANKTVSWSVGDESEGAIVTGISGDEDAVKVQWSDGDEVSFTGFNFLQTTPLTSETRTAADYAALPEVSDLDAAHEVRALPAWKHANRMMTTLALLVGGVAGIVAALLLPQLLWFGVPCFIAWISLWAYALLKADKKSVRVFNENYKRGFAVFRRVPEALVEEE